MKSKIYLITNTVNNKQYIGATITSVKSRWNRHISDSIRKVDGQVLHQAIRKYGQENFKIEILEEHDDKDYVFNVLEEQYIRKYKTHGSEGGYNMTWGGDGWNGMSHKDSSKKKMSDAHKGKVLTEEHRRNIGLAQLGKKLGPMSEETKKKISLTKLQRGFTSKQRDALKKTHQSLVGKTHTKETKKKISESQRVYEYNLTSPNGKEYTTTSLNEFCKQHGLDQGNLTRVINKNKGYNQHKGWTGTKKDIS